MGKKEKVEVMKDKQNQSINQSIKTNPELTQMLELTEKDIKTAYAIVFHVLKSEVET